MTPLKLVDLMTGDGGPVLVHPVLDPPKVEEDAGVAEHDHQVGQGRHQGPVHVGECPPTIVINYRTGPSICEFTCFRDSTAIPVFSM